MLEIKYMGQERVDHVFHKPVNGDVDVWRMNQADDRKATSIV